MKRKTSIFFILFLFLFVSAPAQKKIDGKKIKSVKEWRIEGKKKRLDVVTVYDENGKKTEEINYDKLGDQKERITYEYDENGKCVTEKYFDKFNKPEKTVTWEYFENGKKKAQNIYFPNGKLKYTTEFEYILE